VHDVGSRSLLGLADMAGSLQWCLGMSLAPGQYEFMVLLDGLSWVWSWCGSAAHRLW
jgi:hypothetical protein